MDSQVDPFIGETFEDRDPRVGLRRIRIVEGSPLGARYYVAEVVAHPFAEIIGRRSTVSAETLRVRYLRVNL